MVDVVEEIAVRCFDGRGFVRDRADEMAGELKEFGVRTGSTARYSPEFHSGDIVHHARLGVWRVYSGNVAKTGRWDRHTYYVYDYIEIPDNLTDEQMQQIVKILNEKFPVEK